MFKVYWLILNNSGFKRVKQRVILFRALEIVFFRICISSGRLVCAKVKLCLRYRQLELVFKDAWTNNLALLRCYGMCVVQRSAPEIKLLRRREMVSIEPYLSCYTDFSTKPPKLRNGQWLKGEAASVTCHNFISQPKAIAFMLASAENVRFRGAEKLALIAGNR